MDESSQVGLWRLPDYGQVKFNVDGSCSFTQFFMGGGGVLRDHNGIWIAGFSSSYGFGSAIQAECLAMEDGLKLAWNLGFRNVIMECDCMELVQIINDNLPTRLTTVAGVVKRIRSWLKRDWLVQVSFVVREVNMVADFLAKEGRTNSDGFKEWSSPPSAVLHLLDQDLASFF
ncbi:ubiquitin-specific protease ubp15 [Orobanche gracilis]